MIKIENVEIHGWDAAIRGMRNPHNSWDKSDSYWTYIENPQTKQRAKFEFFMGENDLTLATALAKAGTDHGKVLRYINVSLDITAPFYFWKEFETYKVGTVSNSCSTMHKLHSKPIELDDFSHEHLRSLSLNYLYMVVEHLNIYRKSFLESDDKQYWWQLIQLLPSSYNQRRTIQLNYAVLRAMYHARKNHKLDEWRDFCAWIETLPYAKELILSV